MKKVFLSFLAIALSMFFIDKVYALNIIAHNAICIDKKIPQYNTNLIRVYFDENNIYDVDIHSQVYDIMDSFEDSRENMPRSYDQIVPLRDYNSKFFENLLKNKCEVTWYYDQELTKQVSGITPLLYNEKVYLGNNTYSFYPFSFVITGHDYLSNQHGSREEPVYDNDGNVIGLMLTDLFLCELKIPSIENIKEEPLIIYASSPCLEKNTCETYTSGQYLLEYETNGGNSLSLSVVNFPNDTNDKLPTPERDGYVFAGWYFDKNFTKKVTSTTTMITDTPTPILNDKGCQTGQFENITIYAKWEKLQVFCGEPNGGGFTLKFETNGGNKIADKSVGIPLPSYEKLPTPERDGYIFSGWYLDKDLKKAVESDNLLVTTPIPTYDENGCRTSTYETITIYAKWEKLQVFCGDPNGGGFTLKFETNGGNKIADKSVGFPLPLYEKLPIPTKSGYIFSGWYLDEHFEKAVESETVLVTTPVPTYDENGCRTTTYKPVTIYAKWEKIISANNVSIYGEEEIIPDITKIKVENLNEIIIPTGYLMNKYHAYDIVLLDSSNNPVQPKGYIELRIPIPSDFDKNKISVFRIEDDKYIYYESTISDSYATIRTNHFSTYVIAEGFSTDDAVAPPKPATDGNVNNNQNVSSTTESERTQNVNSGSFAISAIAGLISLLLLILIIRYRYKKQMYKI